jgi:hypothetical protein
MASTRRAAPLLRAESDADAPRQLFELILPEVEAEVGVDRRELPLLERHLRREWREVDGAPLHSPRWQPGHQ